MPGKNYACLPWLSPATVPSARRRSGVPAKCGAAQRVFGKGKGLCTTPGNPRVQCVVGSAYGACAGRGEVVCGEVCACACGAARVCVCCAGAVREWRGAAVRRGVQCAACGGGVWACGEVVGVACVRYKEEVRR